MASSLEARIRLAPSSANRLAMPLPMPRLAPVIRTLFSSNRFMVGIVYLYDIFYLSICSIAASTSLSQRALFRPPVRSRAGPPMAGTRSWTRSRAIRVGTSIKPALRRQTSKHATPDAQERIPTRRRRSVDAFFARLASHDDQKLAFFAGPLLARFFGHPWEDENSFLTQ